ncbi:MAG TPA: hypothetical protein VMR00_13775 [Streptosporangiaceae bacterium]|nr:hypothetical protein [Streptosporangiaceae bacterium]
MWESAGVHGPFQAILRSALTSEQAAATLGEFLTSAILGPVSAVAAETDPGGVQFRASLVVTQMLGLAMSRCVLKIGPVAAARPEQLAAAIGPTIDRYLTGDLGVPEGD